MAGEVPLDNIADVIMGQSPPGHTYNEGGNGLPFFQGVKDFGYRFPVRRVYCTTPSRIARPGDILLSVRAPIGRVNVAPFNCAIGRGLAIIRPKHAEEGRFLEFALRFLEPTWEAIEGAGSVFGNANRADIEGVLLPWPQSIYERRAIAEVLGALDNKIELNRRMNATLEAMAKALFKSWFVDFDPVRAKAEGRQPAGMDTETASLFPDGFEESALGEIPRGWRVAKLSEVAEINRSSITKDYPHREIEYIDISSVTKGRLSGTNTYLLSKAPSRARRLVKHGDTIWSTVRPNRMSYLFIHKPGDNLVVSTGFAVLSPVSIPPSYLYLCVTTDEFVDYLSYSADGSAYPAVLPQRFAEPLTLVPPCEVLRTFENHVGPMLDKVAHNEKESRTLAALRDALLPRLMSGEVRVKDNVSTGEKR